MSIGEPESAKEETSGRKADASINGREMPVTCLWALLHFHRHV
jgi:hypothetical protein